MERQLLLCIFPKELKQLCLDQLRHDEQIEKGEYQLVYTTPESFFNKFTKELKEIFLRMSRGYIITTYMCMQKSMIPLLI